MESTILKKRFEFLADDEEVENFRFRDREREYKKALRLLKEKKAKEKLIRKRMRLKELAVDLKDEIDNHIIKNIKPRTDKEKMILEKMIKHLGVITSVSELAGFLKMNTTCIYKAIDNGEILTFRIGKRIFIITEGIIPFLRAY